MSNQENIFYEKQGDTNFSITKGIFYIPDLHSKHLAYKVMKHIKYDKPIIEYCWDKIKAQAVLKGLMNTIHTFNAETMAFDVWKK